MASALSVVEVVVGVEVPRSAGLGGALGLRRCSACHGGLPPCRLAGIVKGFCSTGAMGRRYGGGAGSLTVEHVAQMLGAAPNMICHWPECSQIPGKFHVGRSLRFHQATPLERTRRLRATKRGPVPGIMLRRKRTGVSQVQRRQQLGQLPHAAIRAERSQWHGLSVDR